MVLMEWPTIHALTCQLIHFLQNNNGKCHGINSTAAPAKASVQQRVGQQQQTDVLRRYQRDQRRTHVCFGLHSLEVQMDLVLKEKHSTSGQILQQIR